MIRRLAGVGLVAVALLALLAGSAAAEIPAGPRLTFMRATDARFDLLSADPSGRDQQVIFGGGTRSHILPFPFIPPTWSGDGTLVAFSGITPSRHRGALDLYDAAADGSGLTRLTRTEDALDPVLSADGRTLAFARERKRKDGGLRRRETTEFRSVTTWLLDLGTGTLHRLTPWQNNRFEYPSSFSPDGSTLLLSKSLDKEDGSSSHSIVAMNPDGSSARVLLRNAAGAVYSPDGTRLALITVGKTRTIRKPGEVGTFAPTDLAVANADGTDLHRLTHTQSLEVEPSWDPSGQRIAYTEMPVRLDEASFLGFGDSIFEVNADGSCRTKILSFPRAILFGATWQPGPGRGAGPISC